MNKYDKQHNKRLAAYGRKVDAIYKAAISEAARLGVSVSDAFDKSKAFSFADYPATKRKCDELLKSLSEDLTAAIVNGVRSEWTLANNKNNELCRQVFGDNVGKLSKAEYRRYFNNNDKALKAFLQRKESGLNLSDRVWKYTNQFKDEIEMGLDLGIRAGRTAPEMAAELKAYLQHPDKLFRRVRDEHGQLHLSKAAAAYHPGRGVYRSSYKNARRLTATETNIAYRTADYTRWQQLDFVVGIEVRLSPTNHPIPDICDDLKGKYPKDFKFTGWHPHCRCHAVTILKTPEEMAKDNKRIMQGEEPAEGSENTVSALPGNFTAWMNENADRIEAAQNRGTLPYFIRDNFKVEAKTGISHMVSTEGVHLLSETKLEAAINKARKKLVRQEREKMVVLNSKGVSILEIDGNSSNVFFDEETAKKVVNATITHNHPTGKNETGVLRFGYSLSPDDVYETIRCNARCIIAEAPYYRYSMTRPRNGWRVDANLVRKRYREVHREITEKYGDSMMKHHAPNIVQHLTMKHLAKEFSFIYRYEKKG